MTDSIFIPHPALREIVLCYTAVDVQLPSDVEPTITPYPATPLQSIIFYGNHPLNMRKEGMKEFEKQASTMIIGPQYSRVDLVVNQCLKCIRVDFRPGGLFRLLGIPMKELFDEAYDAEQIFAPDIKELNERLANTPNLETQKCIVEMFLLRRLDRAHEALPFDKAMQILLENNGNLRINELAAIACLSLRQFERKCGERIGMPPKTFAKITRFSKAYRLREAKPNLSWTAIAHSSGYHDQMHFIRDFKEFTGVVPTIINAELDNTPLKMQAQLWL